MGIYTLNHGMSTHQKWLLVGTQAQSPQTWFLWLHAIVASLVHAKKYKLLRKTITLNRENRSHNLGNNQRSLSFSLAFGRQKWDSEGSEVADSNTKAKLRTLVFFPQMSHLLPACHQGCMLCFDLKSCAKSFKGRFWRTKRIFKYKTRINQ